MFQCQIPVQCDVNVNIELLHNKVQSTGHAQEKVNYGGGKVMACVSASVTGSLLCIDDVTAAEAAG